MAKADRGTKRQCLKCGTKYYDLNRDPIVCPKCGAPYEFEPAVAQAAAAPEPEPVAAAAVEEPAVEQVETDTAATEAGAEVVSMEEAEEPDTEKQSEDNDENIPDIGGEVDNSYIEEDEDSDNIDFDVKRDEEE